MWLLCFIEGCAKIQGTFECMSNIQLWMTPKRDFRVFFPLLHIFILVSIQVSGWLAAYFAYIARWEYMHLFVCGMFLLMLMVQIVCLRFVRIMPRFPLYARLKVKDFTNVRLIGVGMLGICVYYILLYTRIADYINIELLYLPVAVRGFSYAVISATLLYTLETSMNFKIFFQSLGLFNVFHTVGGAITGCAIYMFGLNHYIADNMQRYGEYVTNVRVASNQHVAFGGESFGSRSFHFGEFMGEYVETLQVISIKQLLGWGAIAAIVVALVFLCLETSFRYPNRLMPDWKHFGKRIRRIYSRRRLAREYIEDEAV